MLYMGALRTILYTEKDRLPGFFPCRTIYHTSVVPERTPHSLRFEGSGRTLSPFVVSLYIDSKDSL